MGGSCCREDDSSQHDVEVSVQSVKAGLDSVLLHEKPSDPQPQATLTPANCSSTHLTEAQGAYASRSDLPSPLSESIVAAAPALQAEVNVVEPVAGEVAASETPKLSTDLSVDFAGKIVMLVHRARKSEHCVFKCAAAIASKQKGVSLTLQGQGFDGLAIVPTWNENKAHISGTLCQLVLGPAEQALRVTYDGMYIVRDKDKHMLVMSKLMVDAGAEIHTLKEKHKSASTRGKAFAINNDGTISPMETPDLVLGVRLPAFCLGSPIVVTSGPHLGTRGYISTIRSNNAVHYKVTPSWPSTEQLSLEGHHMQLDTEAFKATYDPHPTWGRARPLGIHHVDVLTAEDQAWQLEQLTKARSTVNGIQNSSEHWKGDVVCISYDSLGPDKSCSYQLKLFFPGGGKCKFVEIVKNFPMGMFPLSGALAPPDGLANLPYINLMSNIHKFYPNDGLINVCMKFPFLTETDDVYSWVGFDLVDESEGGFLGIAEPLSKEMGRCRGFPIPSVKESSVRVYKESPDDMVIGLYKPSAKLGRTDSMRCGEVALPFPRWLLPTTLLRLVARTMLNYVLNQIGDKLVLGAAADIPDGMDPLQRLSLDWENYFGILKARLLQAESKVVQ